jgi:hypothetical protein
MSHCYPHAQYIADCATHNSTWSPYSDECDAVAAPPVQDLVLALW